MQTTTNPTTRPLRSYTYPGATLKISRDVPFMAAPGELEHLPIGTTVEVTRIDESRRLIFAEPRDCAPWNGTAFGFHFSDFTF